MKNEDIRQNAKTLKVKLWSIAERLGMNDGNFSRKLRKELSTMEKEKISNIIIDIASKEDSK